MVHVQINKMSEILVGVSSMEYCSLEKRDYSVANKTLICIDPEQCKGNGPDPCSFLSERYCREEPARV